jgi:hypothetical protein
VPKQRLMSRPYTRRLMASLHRGVDQAIVSNLGRMMCVFNQLHQSLKIGKKIKIKKRLESHTILNSLTARKSKLLFNLVLNIQLCYKILC